MNNFYLYTVILLVWFIISLYLLFIQKNKSNDKIVLLTQLISLLLILIPSSILLNNRIGVFPPIAKFLDPFSGYLKLVGSDELPKYNFIIDELNDSVNIVWDDRRVPHIYASNDYDLYFVQGYLHAFDRLWQMDFQVIGAAGRVSEILGIQAIEYDRFKRRIGMIYGAEKTLELYNSDPEMKIILSAYTNGINAYINSLSTNEYPLEYKILDYEPEQWTNKKTALLYMYMAWMLTGNSDDLEHTKIINKFGINSYNKLFSVYPINDEPIVSKSNAWKFKPLITKNPDTLYLSNDKIDSLQYQPDPGNGSNNWAISGIRTVSGSPILANDPHLSLSLPSIWYEMHLRSPNMNVYGVSLLGAPGIVIGFNEDIAWGVTNGEYDIMDFYDIFFKDKKLEEYWYNGSWKKTTLRLEQINIKGNKSIIDTIIHTHHGPIVWNDRMQKKEKYGKSIPIGRSMKWLAHKPSLEAKAFYNINRAKNDEEFINALSYFSCPGQNFVFASNDGDIGIWQATDIPIKWKNQGRIIMDGRNPIYDWNYYAPKEHRPGILNPQRGYVSSANQNPVTENYPYYYPGNYALSFRASRINQMIEESTQVDYSYMQKMQLDNKNIFAEKLLNEILPIIGNLDLNNLELEIYNRFKNWDYNYNHNSIEATIFDEFYKTLEKMVWEDEFIDNNDKLLWPNEEILLYFLINEKKSVWFDNINTTPIEDINYIIEKSYKNSIKKLIDKLGEINLNWEWGNYRGTDIKHLAGIKSFSRLNLKTSGGRFMPNATRKNHGPSWRYIVELGEQPKGYGIYPGGQSGFPGSKHYDDYIEDWAAGKLYPLHFSQNIDEINGHRITILSK